ncbi:hypothetical protein ACC785_22675 [Rhizobium ruizarguesonis]
MVENSKVLIHQLLDDVNVLRTLIAENTIPTPEMARVAIVPILRRWICDQQFHLVQRLLGQRIIHFEVWQNKQAEQNCLARRFHHWMEMINVGAFIMSAALPQEQFISHDGRSKFAMGEASRALWPSHKFFNQPLIFLNERLYRRRDILAYHANKLGGVHLDFRRNSGEQDVDDIANHFGFEIIEANYKMLIQQDLREAKSDRSRRGRTYDAMELVAIDTARIFAAALAGAQIDLLGLLEP